MAAYPSNNVITKIKIYTDNLADPVVSDLELYEIITPYALAFDDYTIPNGLWSNYDMYGAAAEVWRIKAARAAKYITTNADGQQYSFNQIRDSCNEQYQYYLALSQTSCISVGDE